MNNEPLLSRSQAATFVGCRSESAVRAAEGKGLPCTRDASGQAWYKPAALDAWPWRNKRPSDAVRAGILRDAAKGARSPHSVRSAAGRELAWYKAADRADALEAKVARENQEAAAAFLRDHMEDTQARELLFPSDKHCDPRRKFRDLVYRRLLTEVPVPRARRVIGVHESATAVEGPWPVVRGGPFFLKSEVFELRRDALDLAREEPAIAPNPISTRVDHLNAGDILSILLAVAELKDRQAPSRGPSEPPRGQEPERGA
jgi:hypothetical protein